MSEIQVLREEETYRLIADGQGRFAVVEARAGHVYSLDPKHSAEAPDSAEGMAEVVGPRGWLPRHDAERLFRHMVRGERHLAETIW